MRVFISIELPKEIKDYLFELQEQFGSDLAKIRFVSKKILHLCLKFLGEVSEEKIEEIKEKLKQLKFKSIQVKLEKLGVFPNENYIRVLWVDLKPAGKIIELKDDIDVALQDLFKKDERFAVHITLGRVKFVKNKEKFKKVLKEFKIEPKEFKIAEFRLVKSTLTKDGPIYETIESYS